MLQAIIQLLVNKELTKEGINNSLKSSQKELDAIFSNLQESNLKLFYPKCQLISTCF